MKKIIDYVLSCVYMIWFGLCLVIFHVVQVIAFNVFGRRAHQQSVKMLNGFLCCGWWLTGSTFTLRKEVDLPENESIIFVANHQSMFDIVGMIWLLRKYTPLFVSKKELSKGIPSISYNLRKGGAALIDRKDRGQAIKEIIRVGRYAKENSYSVAIFPEGTRSRTAELKPFAAGGISTLTRSMPGSMVVPIAIENTGKFNPKSIFPLRSFTNMTWTTLTPIDPVGKTPEEIAGLCEAAIKKMKK